MSGSGNFMDWLGRWLPGAALFGGGFCFAWHALGLDLGVIFPVLGEWKLLPKSILFEVATFLTVAGLLLWGIRWTGEDGEFSPVFEFNLLATRSEAWIEFLDRFIGWSSAGAMSLCGFLLFWSGGARYLAGATGIDILPDWTFEVSVFCLVWAVLLGVARIEKRGGHIRVDFLVAMFPKSAKKWFEAVTIIAAIALSVTFIWSGFVIVEETIMWEEVTENSLFTPYWWMYGALPASFAIHLLFILDRFRRLLMGQLDLNASSHA